MGRYVLQNESIKSVKKLLSKYSSTNIDTARVKGVIKAIGYRKYTWGEEIDIQFTGKIAAKKYSDELTWWDSSILTEEVSLIKINKLIRRACFTTISERMNYFNIKMIGYSSIKKVKWL
jgi:hypothetical protein